MGSWSVTFWNGKKRDFEGMERDDMLEELETEMLGFIREEEHGPVGLARGGQEQGAQK